MTENWIKLRVGDEVRIKNNLYRILRFKNTLVFLRSIGEQKKKELKLKDTILFNDIPAEVIKLSGNSICIKIAGILGKHILHEET